MKQTPKRGLGRGFEALLPADFDKSMLLSREDRVEKIAVSKLQPSPYQPRKHFDETALTELAASITRYGVVQPLVVTPEVNGMFTLIAGERRWRASKLAGLTSVPAIIRSSEELEQMELALIENVQRVDLTPLEQAWSVARLHEQFSLSYEVIAERLGKAPSTISNLARLLQLPEPARKALEQQQISEGHARAILALKDPAEQSHLLASIIQHGWSVRHAERYVSSVKTGVADKQVHHERVNTETPVTKALSKKLGSAVAIRRTAKGGRVELSFKSDAELEKLLALLQKLG